MGIEKFYDKKMKEDPLYRRNMKAGVVYIEDETLVSKPKNYFQISRGLT
jgi:hypothetical protein